MDQFLEDLFDSNVVDVNTVNIASEKIDSHGMCSIQKMLENDAFMKRMHTFITKLLHFADVKEFCEREYYDYKQSDFCGVSENFIVAVTFLFKLLNMCQNEKTKKEIYESNRGIFLMVLMSHTKTNLWSTKESVTMSLKMQRFLIDLYELNSFTELLIRKKDITSNYDHLLKVIEKRFTKDTWKRNPSVVCVYVESLKMVTYPHLSDYTTKVLPPCLMMSDDFEESNKIKAVLCLDHIIVNVTATELLWQGRVHVLYDVLKNDLLWRKCALTTVVLPCVLKILNIIEKRIKIYDTINHFPKHNEIVEVLMREAAMEVHWDMKRLYAYYIPKFIHQMGLHTLKHLKNLFAIIENYLDISDHDDEISRLRTLDIILSFITECWPRVECHIETLLKVLLKLLYNLCSVNSGTRHSQDLQDKAQKCLKILSQVCPRICSSTLQKVVGLQCGEKFCKLLTSLLEDITHSTSISCN